MPHTFTAIDFETAQSSRWSICQVGLVRIENGVITEQISKLVCPPDNQYNAINIGIHKITPEQTRHAPTFAQVWHDIKPYIQNETVVAHNGSFDFSCLSKTLAYYNMESPRYEQRCTYKIYGAKLNVLCKQYNIALNHHDALSDALACAQLYLRHLRG